jgi:hypothetical protein
MMSALRKILPGSRCTECPDPVPLLLFVAASIFYMLFAGQLPFWLDSAEFVAMGAGAGIAHPPGSPLALLLLNLASLLPVGSVAFRMHLLMAASGGATATLVYLVGRQIVSPAGPAFAGTAGSADQALSGTSGHADQAPVESVALPGPGTAGISPPAARPAAWAAAAVAAALALSPAIWLQSVRAEVYSVQSVLCLGTVYAALLWKRDPAAGRFPLLAALLVGLGVANHYYIALLTAAACFLPLLLERGIRERLLTRTSLLALAAFAAACLTLLYLPVRAHHGWMMWGDPSTFRGFVDMLSGKAFHLSVTEMPVAPLPDALSTIFAKWVDLVGWPLFFSGALGLVIFLLTDLGTGLLLAALILAAALSKAVMYLDVENPDDHAYFLAGLQALALSCLGFLRVPELFARFRIPSASRFTPVATRLLVLGLAGWSGALLFVANASTCNLSRFNAPDTVNRHFLGRQAPDTLFMPSYYAGFFSHLYYKGVERRRPDVTLVHQSLFARYWNGAGYRADVVAAHPDVDPVFAEHASTRAFPLASLMALAQTRPVVLENDTLEVSPHLQDLKEYSLGAGGLTVPVDSLSFVGPGLQLREKRLDWARQHENQRAFWTAFYRDMEGTPLHPELTRHLVWDHYRDILYFINDGNWAAALLEVRMARRLTPDSTRLSNLEFVLTRKADMAAAPPEE